MEKQTEILNAVSDIIGLKLSPLLQNEGGYALQVAPSEPPTTSIKGIKKAVLNYTLVGKEKDQQKLADTLYSVCNRISEMQTFGCGITKIKVNSPSLLAVDGEYYIWKSDITVTAILS